MPVVQVTRRKALGDWEDEDDAPVPVRIGSASMTMLKGSFAAWVCVQIEGAPW